MPRKIKPEKPSIPAPNRKMRPKRVSYHNPEKSELQNFICERVTSLRLNQELPIEDFGELVGLTASYVKGVEQHRFTPSHDVLYVIARVFRKDIGWFYGWGEKDFLQQ